MFDRRQPQTAADVDGICSGALAAEEVVIEVQDSASYL